MCNVLVLGGSYFIGRAIVHALRDKSAHVSVLNRGTVPMENPLVVQLTADRSKTSEMRSILKNPFDVVVDVSALTQKDVKNFADAIDWCPERYILISSGAVYDSRYGKAPFVENSNLGGDPVWAEYGVDKTEAEKEAVKQFKGDRVQILRPPYVYGPANYLDREQFIWSRILKGAPIFVPANSASQIQFCHVDVLAKIVASMACDDFGSAGVYNIGEARGYTFHDYIRVLARIAGKRPIVVDAPDQSVPARDFFPFRDYSMLLDTSKLRKLLKTEHPALFEGMGETHKWMVKNNWIELNETEQETRWKANGR